jgi:DNA-binding NtrC family response regulator
VIRAADVQFLHPAETAVVKPREPLTSLRDAERVHILRVLEQLGWNKKQAAKVLEISRGTLYRKILEYELEPNQPEPSPVA